MREVQTSDIRLVISPILGTCTPSRYFDRPNFTTKASSVGKWIIAGFFIALAYKEILLSTLVTTTYAKSINTIDDMLNSKEQGSIIYNVSHPIEPRDFVMFSFMTCDCLLVWLRLGFESATIGHFSEKLRGPMGWETG